MSEKYRVPVMFMMDECVGHMTEKVVIPSADEIEILERRWTAKKGKDYLPFEPGDDLVPDMGKAGDGHRVHVTGLTHDEKGYPVINAEARSKLVRRLVDKINLNADDIFIVEERDTEDADVVVLSYGITARVAERAIELAKAEGLKVGAMRLVTLWPFPERRIRELAGKAGAFVVAELNFGQIYYEVERCTAGQAPVLLAGHAGGTVHDPEEILAKIREACACRQN